MRFFLRPFSLIYGAVIFLRNLLFDLKLFSSKRISYSIGVGNLSMGGTGKSPLAIYLADYILSLGGEPALLSRGYGRKTKGFLEVKYSSSSDSVGDEPLMFKQRFETSAHVFVCENRTLGSDKIREKLPNCTLLYDDIMQHRKISTEFCILTTPFNDPFHRDHLLPVGRLREPRSSAKRADCILVTKCPNEMSSVESSELKEALESHQKPVFFSRIEYLKIRPLGKTIENIQNVLLITGIADPSHLIEHLNQSYKIETISFPDHHAFGKRDIEKIHEKFGIFDPKDSIILTTEKDKVRLSKFDSIFSNDETPWYYQPMNILIEDEVKFKSLIKEHVRTI